MLTDPTRCHVEAHAAALHRLEPTFEELMADQVRRAPWLGLSLLLHALVAFVLWSLPPGTLADPEVSVRMRASEVPDELPVEPPPEEPPVPEDVPLEPELQDAFVDPLDVADEPYEFEAASDTASAFDSTHWNQTVGLAGGAAGRYRGRPGGRQDLTARGGRATSEDIERALEWLARHQDDDGKWDADEFMKHDLVGAPCDGEGNGAHDVGVTGLALLAFLGDGHTTRSGVYRDHVKRAAAWLVEQQDEASGLFGSPSSNEFVYDHAIATLAMVETAGLSGSRLLRRYAQAGLDYLEAHRNPYGVWRYQPRDHENDTSVTGWCVLAYKSAQDFGLTVNRSALEQAAVWLDQMTDPVTGRCGYTERGGASSRRHGVHAAAFPRDRGECMTAVSLLCRIFLGQEPQSQPVLERQADLIARKPPSVEPGAADHYYWYYATYALNQIAGRHWQQWVKALAEPVVRGQRGDGNFRGSWDPDGAWGDEGGRVYSTAILCLTLEAHYRYTPLLR